jgi:hypothetical protein
MHGPTGIFWASLTPLSLQNVEGGRFDPRLYVHLFVTLCFSVLTYGGLRENSRTVRALWADADLCSLCRRAERQRFVNVPPHDSDPQKLLPAPRNTHYGDCL